MKVMNHKTLIKSNEMWDHHIYVLPLVQEAQVVLVPPSHQFSPVKNILSLIISCFLLPFCHYLNHVLVFIVVYLKDVVSLLPPFI